MGRIGVYFDGFNVYYGARHQFKDQSGSWKWYSPKLLINNLIQDVLRDNTRLSVAARQLWGQGDLVRVVFCTAEVFDPKDPQKREDQNSFLKAIQAGGHVDHIEYGHYVKRVKQAPLALKGPNDRPVLVTSDWPVMVKERNGVDVVDAAVVVSNDSDLAMPIAVAREHVPVGIVNPSGRKPHRSLTERQDPTKDWFRYLNPQSYVAAQMPGIVKGIEKPSDW